MSSTALSPITRRCSASTRRGSRDNPVAATHICVTLCTPAARPELDPATGLRPPRSKASTGKQGNSPINGQKSPLDDDKSRQSTDCVAGMFFGRIPRLR
jgi:hypothetical protein